MNRRALSVGLLSVALALVYLASGISDASFADTVTSNGNAFAATSLSAPSLSSGTSSPVNLGSSISLTVTPPGGNLTGTTWDILRGNTCASLSFLKNIGTGTSTTDTPTAGGGYCYAARGKYNNWLSANSNTVGVFSVVSTTNIHANTTLSPGAAGTGTESVNHLSQIVYTSTAAITSANNEVDWQVVLILKDKPDVATSINFDIWWQNTSCSATPVAGQVFATGAATVPIAVDKMGVTLTISAATGTVNHTFIGTDRLCLRVDNNAPAGANDLHYYGDTASTSGTTGISRVIGPFTP